MKTRTDSFGTNMKKRRNTLGMSLEELADKIGSNKQTLSKYENNKREPMIGMAQKIADALGVKISDLTELDQNGIDLSRNERVLIEYYRTLNSEGKRTIMSTIRAFVGNPDMTQESITRSAT